VSCIRPGDLVPITNFSKDTNTWYSKYMPISANAAYDRFGGFYDASKVVQNGVFNQSAYQEYSPMFLPATFAFSYGVGFAGLSALLSHTWLWYRRDLFRLFRSSLSDHKDVHARLMLNYKEVPGWWYLILGVISFTFGVVAVEAWPTGVCLFFFGELHLGD
jgi:hypothetical protein